jgi:hypothetical protein
MCRYGTRASTPTGPSVAPTSSSTRSQTPTPVRAAKFCSSTVGHSPCRGPASQSTTRGSTEPVDPTAPECALKARCCPGQPRREVLRSVHETSREVVRGLADTPEYLQSRRERKKIEMLFAHLKRILKLNRLRLRGHPARRTSSCSPRLHRTRASWPRWSGRSDVRHIREWHELGGTGTDRPAGSPRSPARDPKQQPHRHTAL